MYETLGNLPESGRRCGSDLRGLLKGSLPAKGWNVDWIKAHRERDLSLEWRIERLGRAEEAVNRWICKTLTIGLIATFGKLVCHRHFCGVSGAGPGSSLSTYFYLCCVRSLLSSSCLRPGPGLGSNVLSWVPVPVLSLLLVVLLHPNLLVYTDLPVFYSKFNSGALLCLRFWSSRWYWVSHRPGSGVLVLSLRSLCMLDWVFGVNDGIAHSNCWQRSTF